VFSFVKKVDRNLSKKDLPKINDLKKSRLFFGAFLSMYLVFKTVVPMSAVGFRRQMQITPQILLMRGLIGVQQLDAINAKFIAYRRFLRGLI
jgi:hypothetical protein